MEETWGGARSPQNLSDVLIGHLKETFQYIDSRFLESV